MVDNKCKGEQKSKGYFTKPHIVKNLLSQDKSGYENEVASAAKGVFKTSLELSQKSWIECTHDMANGTNGEGELCQLT